MAVATSFANAPDLSTDSYVVLGVATCFVREDGEVNQIRVIEPIPSATLETLFKGVPTSYELAQALTLGDVIQGGTVKVPAQLSKDAQIANDFVERLYAAARTYKRYPQTQEHLAVGTTYHEFNYSVERKRILNMDRTVSETDNVKQHAHTHKVL